jgi:hypothetical protein
METWQTTTLGILIGSIIPALISMIMPRKGTVKFGVMVYKVLGMALGQKRATQIGIPAGAWSTLLLVIRTTFTDLSFGIYIASRDDISNEDQEKKIDEYLTLHLKVQDAEKK